MKPFWHPLSVLLLPEPRSFATPGVIRMLLRMQGALELVYGGDRMWPTARQGQRIRVTPPAGGHPSVGEVVVAVLKDVPDLLRVDAVEGGAVRLGADADPDMEASVSTEDVLGSADLPRAGVRRGARHLRRLLLELREAVCCAPDEAGEPETTVLRKYDCQAPYYAELEGPSPGGSLLERIGREVRRGGRVLVAGSGTGKECFALAQAGWEVLGVDFSPRMIELAREEAARRGLDVEFRLGNLLEHMEPPGSLSAVVFTYDVYSFLADRRQRLRLLRRMASWLDRGGRVFLSARRLQRAYEAAILTLQWLRRGGARTARWGRTHTRWIAPDGSLHRSFVQVHSDRALAREARRAGFVVEAWEGGHTMLVPASGDGAVPVDDEERSS